MREFLKSIKTNILGSAVLCIILGIVLMVYPDTSLTLVCQAVGVIVLVTGIGFIISHIRGGLFSLFYKLDLILGLLFLILGVYILMNPWGLLSIIPIVFGVLLIYHGISDLGQAMELRKYEADRWWISIIIAAITIVLGVVIMSNPFGTIDVLMRIIGACLVYDGLSNLLIVGKFSRSIRRFKKFEEEAATDLFDEDGAIEGEYKEL